MRDVKFIDYAPPPKDSSAGGRAGKTTGNWTGFVIGVLSQQPGRWALIETVSSVHDDQQTLRNALERNGVPGETCTRQGVLYARVTA